MKPPVCASPDNAPWGLYDTKDRCWLGNDAGPVVYDGVAVPLDMARCSEIITNERFGYTTRIRLCAYDGSANRKRDDVTPRRTFAEALQRLEVSPSVPREP